MSLEHDKAVQETIRNELKTLIRKKGIKQLELTKLIGVSAPTLTSFLSHGKDISLLALGKIEQFVEKNKEKV